MQDDGKRKGGNDWIGRLCLFQRGLLLFASFTLFCTIDSLLLTSWAGVIKAFF